LVFLTLLLFGCASAYDVHHMTSGNNNSASAGRERIFYALPRTVVTVDASVEKRLVEKGPCNAHIGLIAEKLAQPGTKMTTVAIGSRHEADADHVYAIDLSRAWYQKLTSAFTLTEDGLLTSADMTAENQAVDFAVTTLKTVAGLAVKLGLGVGATAPEFAANDTRDQVEQKCKTLKNELVKVRKLQHDLAHGTPAFGEALPDGAALALLFQKLEAQEQQILANFVGEVTTKSGIVHCEVVPDDADLDATKPLFTIATDGIRPAAGAGCRVPADLAAAAAGNQTVAIQFTTKRDTQLAGVIKDAVGSLPSPSGLVYRIPVTTGIAVLVGNDVRAFDRRPVAQFGVVTSLPRSADVSTFQSTVNAALYPGTGALQKLTFSGTPQGTAAVTGVAGRRGDGHRCARGSRESSGGGEGRTGAPRARAEDPRRERQDREAAWRGPAVAGRLACRGAATSPRHANTKSSNAASCQRICGGHNGRTEMLRSIHAPRCRFARPRHR
jgi:hypothetical protein